MKTVSAIAVILVSLLASTDAFAQEGWLGAKLRQWNAELDGKIKATDNGTSGTDVDVESDLGLSGADKFNEIQLYGQFPILGRITLQRWNGKFEGDQQLAQTFTFGGSTYTAGDVVHTKFDFEVDTLMWQFGLSTPSIFGTHAGLGLQLGAKRLTLDATLTNETAGINETAKIAAPFPVIGAYLRVAAASQLFVEVQVHGISTAGAMPNFDGTLIDGTISVDYQMGKFFIGVGYKMFSLHAEDTSGAHVDEAKLRFDMTGLFFEIGASL